MGCAPMKLPKDGKKTEKTNVNHPKFIFKSERKVSNSRMSKSKNRQFMTNPRKYKPKLEVIHEIPLAYEFSNDVVVKMS